MTKPTQAILDSIVSAVLATQRNNQHEFERNSDDFERAFSEAVDECVRDRLDQEFNRGDYSQDL